MNLLESVAIPVILNSDGSQNPTNHGLSCPTATILEILNSSSELIRSYESLRFHKNP